MPPKAHKNPRELAEQEGRILLAISAIQKGDISNTHQASSIFKVPYSTLYDHLYGKSTRLEKRANSHKLTKNEEESLLKWILSMDQRGAAPRQAHIQEMANILLSKRGTTPIQTVGGKWVYNYIKHHIQLKTRYARHYNHQRAKCEDPKIIGKWFNDVQIMIMQYGIAQEDIYNFDETGFAMGLIATTKVVTRAEMVGKPKLIQPGNREWVTSIECINSTGWTLPSCIVFKGQVHIQGWYEDGALPEDWRIEVSNNGWTTDKIGLRWLQNIFIPSKNRHTIGEYCLLVLDGHGSHLTPQFDEICSQNNIIPICMPAHSSHLLQPLDVACFSPLKKAYGKLVENQARLGFNHIDKLDFLRAYPQAHMEAFKPETIKNGFAAAGLIPLNPERVLSQLNIQLRTPTPPCSQSTNSAPKTPHNLKQLEKQATTIKRLLRHHTQSPSSPTKTALNQLVKGCEVAMNGAVLLAKENQDLRMAHEKEIQKRKRSRRQMANIEGLSIQEGQELVQGENQGQEVQEPIPMEPASSTIQPPKRAPRTCSECHTSGHDRRMCHKVNKR